MTFVFLKRYDHYVIVNDDADFIVGSVSTTVPIVMAIVGDPVAGGIVTSLAQPGGNITGRNTARCDGWHGAHVDRTQSIPCLPWAVLSLVHLAMLRPSREDEALASRYRLGCTRKGADVGFWGLSRNLLLDQSIAGFLVSRNRCEGMCAMACRSLSAALGNQLLTG